MIVRYINVHLLLLLLLLFFNCSGNSGVVFFDDYVSHEKSWQRAIIDYLFSMNFHGSIFLLLDICREN